MLTRRSSGILLHVTSLPGPYGIGTIGRGAFEFLDFLQAAGQSCWQILPCGPVSAAFDNSPYMSLSAFAGNQLLIDPEQLVEDGLLSRGQLPSPPRFSEYLVDFDQVRAFNQEFMDVAFKEFVSAGGAPEFNAFCNDEVWLGDHAFFMALREKFVSSPWVAWPNGLPCRDSAVVCHWREELKARILFHKFAQYCFAGQWRKLRDHAHGRGIRLVGDLPIYVAFDSADVWAHQDCFLLDRRTGMPTHVAGVPPDYFSDDGQRWGNPIFRWKTGKIFNGSLLAWWRERFARVHSLVDAVRIDHFRGFEAYWQIPANEETAINGKWTAGPGLAFFAGMKDVIGDMQIIAEDLGVITPEVVALRDSLGYPGMKVLQFAFDSGSGNAYLPHNYETNNCVVYTGTHDNDTTLGWYLSDKSSSVARDMALRYANSRGERIHWDFIRLAYASVAALAMVPLQDVLGFGSDCRMNIPGTARGNWRWRCAARFLTAATAEALREEAACYNRLPSYPEKGDAG